MQNHFPENKKRQKKIFSFYTLLFILIFLCSHAGYQKHSFQNTEKPVCITYTSNGNGLINVNEMLFAITSFDLYDWDDTSNP